MAGSAGGLEHLTGVPRIPPPQTLKTTALTGMYGGSWSGRSGGRTGGAAAKTRGCSSTSPPAARAVGDEINGAELEMQRSLDWVRMEASRCLTVPRLLLAVAVFFIALPSQAQWGGGDGAQAEATAYCAARAAGKDDNQATGAASRALVLSMGGSLTSNLATVIVGGKGMWESVFYLASKQCPQYSRNPTMQEGGLNPSGFDWMNSGSSAYYSEPGSPSAPESDPHEKCLRAADYAGCMKFQQSK